MTVFVERRRSYVVCMKNGEERTGHSAGSRECQAHRAEWERAEKEGRQRADEI